ncbi:MAG: tyrosine-type recombinase/integrase [Hyphomicrobium sp.]|nr:tyrosine-type recombinase/integrase [Hyphomicrobium sp.]
MGSSVERIGPQTAKAMRPGDIIWDADLKRFGARRQAGAVTYVVKLRIDGRQRWITLGKDGPMTAHEARQKARHVLALADSGADPTHERETSRNRPIFSDFAETWLRTHVAIKRKPKTLIEYRRMIAANLNPVVGKLRVDRIDRADAVELHATYAGSPYVANRSLAVLSSIMSHAERLGYRPPNSNPVRGVERFRERKRKRPLSRAELSALWEHLKTLDGQISPYVVAAFRLLLLTGMRREEVLGLEWESVDLVGGVLHLKDAKTGPRDVVLSSAAVKLISELPRIEGNPYVLPGAKEAQHLANITDRWQDIRKTLGFPDVRIHDLRHTVASELARSAPLTVVRDALGHAEITTTSGYSHAAADDVRAAVNAFATVLSSGNTQLST